jgi:hypothetical protein
MADERKECCKKQENLEKQPSHKPELVIMKCKVCGCRHYELTLAPGIFGVEGRNVNG